MPAKPCEWSVVVKNDQVGEALRTSPIKPAAQTQTGDAVEALRDVQPELC